MDPNGPACKYPTLGGMTMDEHRDVRDDTAEGQHSRSTSLLVLCSFLVLAVGGLILVYYNFQQKGVIGQLSSQAADMNSTITELRGQVDSTNAKLNDIAAAEAAARQAAADAAKNGGRPGTAALSRAEANRLKQLQAGLDDQKKQLQATQDDVAKTRTDLQGNLDSTRDELNGSIAKTHEELVVLEKRGERSYFEFDAPKSKQFARSGPLSISLRRADPKHANVDLVVLVNDREISKKKVNLYEPVWVYESQDAQPIQVVVNNIQKNMAHGYISAPKYSPEELNAGATIAPASLKTPATDQPEHANQQ
jgi:hypothetical protein